MLHREQGRGRPARCADLVVDVLDMVLGRARRHSPAGLRSRGVGQATRHEAQDLDLAVTQSRRASARVRGSGRTPPPRTTAVTASGSSRPARTSSQPAALAGLVSRQRRGRWGLIAVIAETHLRRPGSRAAPESARRGAAVIACRRAARGACRRAVAIGGSSASDRARICSERYAWSRTCYETAPERSRPLPDRIGDGHPPDVVKQGRDLEPGWRLPVEADRRRRRGPVLRRPPSGRGRPATSGPRRPRRQRPARAGASVGRCERAPARRLSTLLPRIPLTPAAANSSSACATNAAAMAGSKMLPARCRTAVTASSGPPRTSNFAATLATCATRPVSVMSSPLTTSPGRLFRSTTPSTAAGSSWTSSRETQAAGGLFGDLARRGRKPLQEPWPPA